MISVFNRRPTLWTIPAFLIGFGIALFFCQPDRLMYSDKTSESGTQCYYRATVDESGTDYALVTLSLAGADTYVGVYNWVPAGRDASRGFWRGVVDPSGGITTINALSTMGNEGQITLQQQIFRITGDTLAIGSGELRQTNNILSYTNLNTLDFSGASLSKVDCKDIPVEAL